MMAGPTLNTAGVRPGLLFALVCGSILLAMAAATPDELGIQVPAGRRFHARFVVDRIVRPRPTLPPSTDDRSTASAPVSSTEPTPAPRTPSTTRCREGCLQKRSIKDILCTQQRECSMCWDVCNRNHQIRKENEQLAHRLLLSLVRLIRNESVVTADIEWTTPEELVEHQPHPVVPSPLAASENVERLSRIARDGVVGGSVRDPGTSRILQTLASLPSAAIGTTTTTEEPHLQQYHQCLVSWEISGGGLTGNLLTETSKVELSLWPNTKYHVHVTCRNKETDALIRSSSLLVDTREAVIVSLQGTSSTTTETPLASWAPAFGTGSINSAVQRPPPPPLATNRLDELERVAADEDVEDVRMFAAGQQQQQQRRHRPHGAFWPFDRSELTGSSGGSKEIVILGVFVALLALLLVALNVVIMVRRKPGQPEDRELLIESEVLPKILHV
uniref:Fibronectin type-III domain-containing protein n=1 Tax=Anopheles farauti TaxID=69004 RepID=A0A182QAQ7_9DIPT